MDVQCRCCHPYSTLAQVDCTSIEAGDSRLYPPAMPRVGQDFLQVQGGVQLLGNGLVNLSAPGRASLLTINYTIYCISESSLTYTFNMLYDIV